MVAKRWRVVRLSDADGQATAKLAPPEQAHRLREWVGAESPLGTIVRTFGNEGAGGQTSKFGSFLAPDSVSLSVTSLDAATIKARLFDEIGPPSKEIRETPPTKLTALPAGDALIVVHLKGLGRQNGEWMSFRRVSGGGSSDNVPPTPYFMVWLPSLPFPKPADKREAIRAFVVPAGHWVVSAVGQNLSAVSFCISSPGFDVGQNEAVFAGTFDLSADNVGPDMNMVSAQRLLADRPPLAGALRPAQWTNGLRTPCGAPQSFVNEVAIYALDVSPTAALQALTRERRAVR
jgi:hypothetical protein